jgi:hypothetical protein
MLFTSLRFGGSPMTSALRADVVSHPMEEPMTTHTRQATVTAYYLGRPAALWRTALAPRPTAGKSPRSSIASKNQGLAPSQHIR